jgi:phosphoribosylformylglycinamidine cyclo-ligase
MRLEEPFVYRITDLREPPPIFSFIMNRGPVERREMHATFNMGAGFAVYVDAAQADAFLRVARETGYDAWRAGTVTKQGARKAVEVPPLGITFEAESLQVR